MRDTHGDQVQLVRHGAVAHLHQVADVVEGDAVVQEGAEELNRLPGNNPAAVHGGVQRKVTEVCSHVQDQGAVLLGQPAAPVQDLMSHPRHSALHGPVVLNHGAHVRIHLAPRDGHEEGGLGGGAPHNDGRVPLPDEGHRALLRAVPCHAVPGPLAAITAVSAQVTDDLHTPLVHGCITPLIAVAVTSLPASVGACRFNVLRARVIHPNSNP
mmetsp:Transcript_9971/g.21289  ORF Transcript_9971/g.21289 Transcript_9971/m.21289 type:complete len:212 (-) Transcript_9971:253-888(-)